MSGLPIRDSDGFGGGSDSDGFGRIPGGVRSGDESIETRNLLSKLGRFWAILDEFGRFGAILVSKLKLSPKWVPDSDGFGQSDSDGFGRIPEAQTWNAATQLNVA
jgi:hypothetical protein